MSTATFFDAENARSLPPLGVCSLCGVSEDPMLAIFWPSTDDGHAQCPTCTGDCPQEGYEFSVFYTRKDRGGGVETMLGPYSAGEAARTGAYLLQLDNIKAVRVAQKPEWF
jgi:hypothetical protein